MKECILYFGSILTVLTTDPNIETCGLNCVFGTHPCDGFELRSLATLKEELEVRSDVESNIT